MDLSAICASVSRGVVFRSTLVGRNTRCSVRRDMMRPNIHFNPRETAAFIAFVLIIDCKVDGRGWWVVRMFVVVVDWF